jgi:saccharopine dehydrogenase-like NADP-dependent oxidoreductase
MMKILILGGGLMGPAAAFNALSDPEVSQVIICDLDQGQLEASLKKLKDKPGAHKLGVIRLDLNNHEAAAQLMANFDAVVAALPQVASGPGMRAALLAGAPLVDLSMPLEAELPALRELARQTGGLAVLACGLEPGLTEIMARSLAEKLDRVDELHIKCGGIPEKPTPPLGYKIVFGGKKLPLRDSDARMVVEGRLESTPRYSGVELVTFPGVGQVEAWHEGFMPWLLDLPALQNLQVGTQKTVRWPGYAAKVTVLKELGLLSLTPIQVDGHAITPKDFLDALLYPKVKLEEDERDITTFRVEAIGQQAGRRWRWQAELVDRYDQALGFTSMARTTAFTGTIVARMIARGDISHAHGLLHPEQIITGPHFDRLLEELAALNVTFQITSELLT